MIRRSLPSLALAAIACAALVRFAAPAHEVHAGTALALRLADLVDRSEDVLEGRVVDARSQRAAGGRVETEYRLRVERVLLGRPTEELVFRVPGGVLPDGSGMLIAGMPAFDRGEDVVVFLSRASSNGTRVPIGLSQGKFRVVVGAGGQKLLVRDQRGLSLVASASAPVEDAPLRATYEYDAAMSEIERLVRTRDERARARREASNGEGR